MSGGKNLEDSKMLKGLADERAYRDRLKQAQIKLLRIQQWAAREKQRLIVAVEGWDAAGKGGMIQRLAERLDPRSLSVWRIAAPTPEEQGHHYLWRFWRRLPQRGEFAVFDRTWYGRVLVERIEGLTPKPAWKRAYAEIVEFERQLTDDGVRLVKLLLHVSVEEQRRRIIERLDSKEKRYKVGLEDFRNMAKRNEYLEAYNDMLEKTDTPNAPWTVVACDYKWRARIEALDAIGEQLARDADLEPPPLAPEVAAAAATALDWKPSKSDQK